MSIVWKQAADPEGACASTIILAAWFTPDNVAVTKAQLAAVTGPVLTVNVADVAPGGTVTVAGTPTVCVELASETIAPPVPAGPVRVIVPVAGWPPATTLGLMERLASPAGNGLMVMFAVAYDPA